MSTNVIICQPVSSSPCPEISNSLDIFFQHRSFLQDESRLQSNMISNIFFPRDSKQLSWAVHKLISEKKSCVISAGRTGITGGSVPQESSIVISLQQMNKILALGNDSGRYYIRVQPGVTLSELKDFLSKKSIDFLSSETPEEHLFAINFLKNKNLKLWFPVDPTEPTAHLGGAISCNASGARSYKYGSIRPWVKSLKVMLANASEITIRRGEIIASNQEFILQEPDGFTIHIPISDINLPKTKHTLGYELSKDMDLIDLFIGNEGTLGIVTEIELYLDLEPRFITGIMLKLRDESSALDIVELLKAKDFPLIAIEYFDYSVLETLQKDYLGSKEIKFFLQDLDNGNVVLYLELISDNDVDMEVTLQKLSNLLSELVIDFSNSWLATTPKELALQKSFRHAAPEVINQQLAIRSQSIPGLHKIATDMSVSDQHLRHIFSLYRQGLLDNHLDGVIFGHIGDNHLHVNILPNSLSDLEKARLLYESWAKEIVSLGGSVSSEHGIGRLKRNLLSIQYSPDIIAKMEIVKRCFDPANLFSPGVLFYLNKV